MITLIGEAPGKNGKPGEPALLGNIGRRVARLMGTTEEQYQWQTRRENLLPHWPGKAKHGNGDAWPAKRARAAARVMVTSRQLDGHVVILLGRRVADAFGIRRDVQWFTWTDGVIGTRFAVAPHPSGASRWWNEPKNMRAAGRFWRAVYRRTLS